MGTATCNLHHLLGNYDVTLDTHFGLCLGSAVVFWSFSSCIGGGDRGSWRGGGINSGWGSGFSGSAVAFWNFSYSTGCGVVGLGKSRGMDSGWGSGFSGSEAVCWSFSSCTGGGDVGLWGGGGIDLPLGSGFGGSSVVFWDFSFRTEEGDSGGVGERVGGGEEVPGMGVGRDFFVGGDGGRVAGDTFRGCCVFGRARGVRGGGVLEKGILISK